jgi:predicted amidohydrolase
MLSRTLLFCFPVLALASNLIENPRFKEIGQGSPADWSTWSPRAEIRPKFGVVHSDEGDALSIQSETTAQYGKWITAPLRVDGGKFYRFEVEYSARNVKNEDVSVAAMLSWFTGENKADAMQRDYVDKVDGSRDWKRMRRILQAPAGSTILRVELIFRWAENGSVQWRAPMLIPVDTPAPRKVRVATSHIRPKAPYTIESNLKLMTDMIDAAAGERADIVCLSEGLAERGVSGALETKAHTVPGPITDQLGASARKNKIWVVTAVVEREGDTIYNTAVLIDRNGRVAGKYRKVHLPTAEAEDGMTPGSDYHVFDTDFGKIGLLICWDNWFVEPARIMRLKGTELVFFPIAGDADDHWDIMSRARAVDNGLYLVSSNTTGGASRIVNPAGEVVTEAAGDFKLAVSEIDLDREWRTKWLSIGPGAGEGRSLYIKERRPDTYSGVLDSPKP